ncbi:hypothetical protein [Streptomyces sp. NPDC005548]|uniref:hypothetical protein n=1 Tax=Streptomyces sp. NPDC005548 TaxID=3364724 RepID=UPI003689A20F
MSTALPPRTESAVMDTSYGPVAIHALSWPGEEPYVALRHPVPGERTLLRLQGQCVTSTAFASRMCDCREQIDAGLKLTATRPGGTMVYLPQEGRNYGLLSKVEIMRQMNRGLSLSEAQRAVGRPASRLSYERIPELLGALDLSGPITLLTGSTTKIQAVMAAGVLVVECAELPQ